VVTRTRSNAAGATSASSKSFTSKQNTPSSVSYAPKFSRCKSPQLSSSGPVSAGWNSFHFAGEQVQRAAKESERVGGHPLVLDGQRFRLSILVDAQYLVDHRPGNGVRLAVFVFWIGHGRVEGGSRKLSTVLIEFNGVLVARGPDGGRERLGRPLLRQSVNLNVAANTFRIKTISSIACAATNNPGETAVIAKPTSSPPILRLQCRLPQLQIVASQEDQYPKKYEGSDHSFCCPIKHAGIRFVSILAQWWEGKRVRCQSVTSGSAFRLPTSALLRASRFQPKRLQSTAHR